MNEKEFLTRLQTAGFIAEGGNFDDAIKAIRRVCQIAADMSFDAGYVQTYYEFEDMTAKLR